MTTRLFWRQAAAMAVKDLRLESRGREALNIVAPFAAMTLLAFGFAFGPGREELERAASAFLWLTVLFAGILAVRRTYDAEAQNGALEGLLISSADRAAIFVGKLGALLTVMFSLFLFGVVLVALLFGFAAEPNLGLLAAAGTLGSIGFATIGSFYSALAAVARAREALLPLLVLPLVVPLLIAAIRVTDIAIGATSGPAAGWLRLAIGFDVVSLAACVIGFEYVVEE